MSLTSVPAYMLVWKKYVGQFKKNLIFRINEHQPSATHQTDSKASWKIHNISLISKNLKY